MRKRYKQNTIIVSSDEEGFKNVFLKKNIWYSKSGKGLEINEQRISQLSYIGIYVSGTRGIQSIAEIKDISKKKDGFGYEVSFYNLRLLNIKHTPVQGREYINLRNLISEHELKSIDIQKASDTDNTKKELKLDQDNKNTNNFESQVEKFKSIFANKEVVFPLYDEWDEKRSDANKTIQLDCDELNIQLGKMENLKKTTPTKIGSKQSKINVRVIKNAEANNTSKYTYEEEKLTLYFRDRPNRIHFQNFSKHSNSGDLNLLINYNSNTLVMINVQRININELINKNEDNFIKRLGEN